MFQMLAATKIIQGIPLSHLAMGVSVVCLVIVLPALFDPKKFRAAVEDFFNSGNGVMRLAGLLSFLIAFLILNTRWSIKFTTTKEGLRSIMPILGYICIFKGIVRLWFPNFVRNNIKRFFQKESYVYAMAIVGLLIGLGIGYLGLWVY